MTTGDIQGMIAPVVVPFTADESKIDEKALRGDVRYLLKQGVHGLSSGGSTGEGAILSDGELARCLEILLEERPKGMPVLAGVIRNSTRDVIAAAKDAARLGADALLVTPPYYFGATPQDNFLHYKAISDAVGLPTIIYNVVPTNIISPEDFLSLLEIDNVVGIKQVDPVKHAEMSVLCAAAGRGRVYSACDQLLYSTYVAGSSGAISALVTIAPRLCVRQWEAFKAGDQETASDIQRRLVPVVRTYLQRPFPGKVKELLNLQDRAVGMGRSPNSMPTEELRTEMIQALTNAGLRQ